ncbi:hypothetical protein WS45_18075 [Burkholderia sp. RF2-non_BP3]|nr:hypothetical protein WS45_18075 [Burkholderia sp. RF2-non_BP3]
MHCDRGKKFFFQLSFCLRQVGDVLTEFADMLDVSLVLLDELGALLPQSHFGLLQGFNFPRTLGDLSDSIFVTSHKFGFFSLEVRFRSFEIRFFPLEARVGLFKRIDFLVSGARMLQRRFLMLYQRGLFLHQLRIDPRQRLDLARAFCKQLRALVTRSSQTGQLLLDLVPTLGKSGTLLRFALASLLGFMAQLAGLASLRIAEFGIRWQDVQQGFRFDETARLMKPEGEPFQSKGLRLQRVRSSRRLCRAGAIAIHQMTPERRIAVRPSDRRNRVASHQLFHRLEASGTIRDNDLRKVLPAEHFGGRLATIVAPDPPKCTRYGEQRLRRIDALNQKIPELDIQGVFPLKPMDLSLRVHQRTQALIFGQGIVQLVIDLARARSAISQCPARPLVFCSSLLPITVFEFFLHLVKLQ